MIFLEKIRNYGFWFLDFLKGRSVYKHYNDIKFILENENSLLSQKRQFLNLNELLNHAVKTTSFYKKHKDYNSIIDFPIIDKNIIRENIDLFLSNKYDKKNLYKASTSGSSGIPFVIFQDKNKKARNTADNIYFYKNNGFSLGNRIYYLRIWNEINKLSFFRRTSQNIIPIDIKELTKERTIDLLDKLKSDISTKAMIAYASTYDVIVNYLPKNLKGKIKLKAIFTMSEYLSESTREKLIDYFDCPVLSRYGNSENGILADQYFNEKGYYRINYASYFIELLNLNSDTPVKNGELGRVVVTDLFNFALPFIRYDTGDVAIKNQILFKGKEIPVFESIEGRKLDFIVSSNNVLLSPHLIDYTLRKYTIIKQFQFIQLEPKKYILKLICKKNILLEKEIIKDLKNQLGDNSKIEIIYVNEIPLLDSGKRKMVLNLMSQKA